MGYLTQSPLAAQVVKKALAVKGGGGLSNNLSVKLVMLSKSVENQGEMEFVSIDKLVPKDHLLRKIDKHIDFNLSYQKVIN